MRKNRYRSKHLSVVTRHTINVGAIILVLTIATAANLIAESRCTQVRAEIGRRERQLAQVEKACERESTRGEELKTAENLDRMLLKHGLAMRYPRPDQIVRLKADGTPYPGQLSVAAIRRQGTVQSVASVTKPKTRKGGGNRR